MHTPGFEPRGGFEPGGRPSSWRLYDENCLLSEKELFDSKQAQIWLQSLGGIPDVHCILDVAEDQ